MFKWAKIIFCVGVLLSACANEETTSTLTPSPFPIETSSPAPIPTKSPQQTGAPNQRAMWIWNAGVIQDENAISTLFEFAKDKNISVLYLYAGDAVTKSPDTLASFIEQATNNGLKIELLFGESGWARTENHIQALALIGRAIAFSEAQPTDQRPFGIHIDVEPYGLSEWNTNQNELITSFLNLVSAIHNQINDASVPLRFSADIPFWFDTVEAAYANETRPLNQFVQDMTDQIVLMDYRNTAGGEDGFIALGMGEIVYAKEVGKLVTIGLETTFQEPAKITFYGLDEATLEQEITDAQPIFATQSAFDGIAIHDYDGYRQLVTEATGTVGNVVGAESCKERVSIGNQLPNAVICSLQYTINDGPIQSVYNNEVVALNPDDVFTIVSYIYVAPEDTQPTDDKIAVEAYLFKDGSEPDYSDGRFTPRGSAVTVLPGEHDGGKIGGPGWIMQMGWNRLVMVLVHYYPPEANETDDRFYIMFSIQ